MWSLLVPLPPQVTSIPFLKWPQAPSTHPSRVILLLCLLSICHHLKLSFLFISYLCKNMLAGRSGSNGPVQVTRAAAEVYVLEKLIHSWGQISPPPTHSYPELPKRCVKLCLSTEPASWCHLHLRRVGGDGWSRESHQDPFLKSPSFTAFSQSNRATRYSCSEQLFWGPSKHPSHLMSYMYWWVSLFNALFLQEGGDLAYLLHHCVATPHTVPGT